MHQKHDENFKSQLKDSNVDPLKDCISFGHKIDFFRSSSSTASFRAS